MSSRASTLPSKSAVLGLLSMGEMTGNTAFGTNRLPRGLSELRGTSAHGAPSNCGSARPNPELTSTAQWASGAPMSPDPKP